QPVRPDLAPAGARCGRSSPPGAEKMDRILIRGGVPLSGTINIGGAKNAALPLMAASLLTPDPMVLAHLPDLADIATRANLLVQHGVAIGIGSARNGTPGGAPKSD